MAYLNFKVEVEHHEAIEMVPQGIVQALDLTKRPMVQCLVLSTIKDDLTLSGSGWPSRGGGVFND